MAHAPDVRAAVRAAYVGGLPLSLAAEKSDVPVATARRWHAAAKKNNDDWDRHRAATLLAAGGGIDQALGRVIVAGLLRCEALLEATEHADDPFEGVKAMAVIGDSVSKLRGASRGMMPETDRLAVASDVLRRLGEYIAKRKPALASDYVEIIEAFGDELAKDHA